jgi:hypothetical protein
MRYLFPANPFSVLLPVGMVVVLLTPSIDPNAVMLRLVPAWVIYMAVWFWAKRTMSRRDGEK